MLLAGYSLPSRAEVMMEYLPHLTCFYDIHKVKFTFMRSPKSCCQNNMRDKIGSYQRAERKSSASFLLHSYPLQDNMQTTGKTTDKLGFDSR